MKPRDFNLFNTSHEFLIDSKKIFTGPFLDIFTVFDNMIFDSSKTKNSNFGSSVFVHELELAINRALYGYLCSLARQ